MKVRFWCLQHGVPLSGEPLWIEAEGAGQWESDTSEMECSGFGKWLDETDLPDDYVERMSMIDESGEQCNNNWAVLSD